MFLHIAYMKYVPTFLFHTYVHNSSCEPVLPVYMKLNRTLGSKLNYNREMKDFRHTWRNVEFEWRFCVFHNFACVS